MLLQVWRSQCVNKNPVSGTIWYSAVEPGPDNLYELCWGDQAEPSMGMTMFWEVTVSNHQTLCDGNETIGTEYKSICTLQWWSRFALIPLPTADSVPLFKYCKEIIYFKVPLFPINFGEPAVTLQIIHSESFSSCDNHNNNETFSRSNHQNQHYNASAGVMSADLSLQIDTPVSQLNSSNLWHDMCIGYASSFTLRQ